MVVVQQIEQNSTMFGFLSIMASEKTTSSRTNNRCIWRQLRKQHYVRLTEDGYLMTTGYTVTSQKNCGW